MAGPLADVRPDERRIAWSAFLTLFGMLAGHTVLETARDALFLSRLPASQLPVVYLLMAGFAVLVSQVRAPGLGRLGHAFGVTLSLLACGAVTGAFWLFGRFTDPWMLRGLYVWSGLVGTLTAVQFWLVLGEMVTITQAKRLYGMIGTGSVLGAVAGAFLARSLSVRLGPESLVLASALLLIGTGLGPALLVRRPDRDLALPAPRSPGRLIAQARRLLDEQPYVTRLGGLVLISTVALTLGDYVFKSTVAHHVPREELGTFFATFYMVLNVLSLLAQVFLMRFFLSVLGLHRALWVLPGLLFLSATGLAFGGGLAAALFLKGSDGTLRYSLHRTTSELLFLPIPDALRSRAKPIIDVIGQRGGQALASLLILGEVSLGRDETTLPGAAALLGVIWIAWAAELRPHYLELFRAALREGTISPPAEMPQLDMGSLEALFLALNSSDDREVLAALDLLAEERRVHLIPALILYHPSEPVVLRALELFGSSGRSDFVPVADRLMSHAGPEVKAAALRARSVARSEEPVLRSAMDDGSPLVRATAVVGLVAGGWISDEAQRVLDELVESRAPAARLALARALARQPAAALARLLRDLSIGPEAEVQVLVAQALGALRDPESLPCLLPMLARQATRGSAREALLAFGEEGVRFLDEALSDLTLPHELRRHIPRTLSRFPAEMAGPVLLRHMIGDPDGMVRFKALRGLGRLVDRQPDLRLDEAELRDAVNRTLETCFRLVHWREVLRAGRLNDPARATPGHDLLADLLRDKEVHGVERAFRLLALTHRGEDFANIHRGLRNASAKVRAGSRELLENVLEPGLREAVVALVDDLPAPARLVGGLRYYPARDVGYEELLVLLLESPGETLRCLAAHHVGELRLLRIRPRLEYLRAHETRLFVARCFERALRELRPPAEDRVAV